MPIPEKKQGESFQDFIERCMSDEVMVNEYTDESQRYAVCVSNIFNKKK